MKNTATSARYAVIALGLGALLVAGGCGNRGGEAKGSGAPGAAGQEAAAPGTPVRVAGVSSQNVRRTVPVTGSIAALQSIDLSPKVAAKVVTVAGREGATVRRGQIVVQQDASDLQTQVQQAQANLSAARSRLAQAETQAKVQVTTSRTAVTDAQELVRSAEAQLALAKRPQRTQEVAVAENAVAQAQARYDKAATDRRRYESLVKQGAAAQMVLDQYVTEEQVARAALDSAKQQLEIARTGGRQEQIASAESALERARGQLRLARANTQQNQVRQDEIRAARAAVAQNQAAVAFARQQVANAAIRSPIDGVISARLTEPGQMAQPGQAVLRLVALDTVFFEAQVPEVDIRAVRPGMPVAVRIDAYPGRSFGGKVNKIYPTASTQSRNFVVRITIPNGGKLLRPGLYARGEIVAESRQGIVIPKDALISREGKTQVFVAENGVAKLRTVRTGVETEETVEVLAGVRSGEDVIVAGQDSLNDGSKIQVQGATVTEHTASAH